MNNVICQRRHFLAGFACAFTVAAAGLTVAQTQTAASAAPEATVLNGQHPAAYYQKAIEVFQAGRRDDAVFLFYLGQLRFRTHLAARRGKLKPDADAAVFSSFSEVVGRPINVYAFGDISALARTIDAVLAFDRANPDRFTPPGEFPQAHANIRKGLVSMRAQVLQQADSIRAQRRKNGLENRN